MTLRYPRLRLAVIVLLAALPFLLAACGQTAREARDEENLMTSVKSFNSMFRWGDYKLASVWIVPSAQEDYWRLVDKYQKDLRIVDFEVRNANLDNAMKKGVILINFRYYMTSKASLMNKTIKQEWAYSELKKSWMVVESGLRQLTASESKD